MKKYLFFLILFANLNYIQAQTFTYKRVITKSFLGDDVLKIKGTISINDTIISITTNGILADLRVVKLQDFGKLKSYRLLQPENSDYEIRITFSKDPFSKKEKGGSLYLETKDYFTNEISTVMYLLIPVN